MWIVSMNIEYFLISGKIMQKQLSYFSVDYTYFFLYNTIFEDLLVI